LLPDARVLAFQFELFCILVAVAALLLAAASASLFPIAMSLCIGATLLAILHFTSVGRDERTALADLVLLTPVALFLAAFLS
jgi:hypothetical protein